MENLEHLEDFDLQQLQKNYDQARGVYQSWNLFSIRSSMVGLWVSLGCVFIALLGLATITLITAIPPMLLNTISGLSWLQTRAARKQVETILAEIRERRRVKAALEAASQIIDPKMHDEALSDFIRRIPQTDDKGPRQKGRSKNPD